MKVRSLVDLAVDAGDVIDFFDRVGTPEQMVSRLERIKKHEIEEFLACIDALRMSREEMLEDAFEVGSTMDDLDEIDGNVDLQDLTQDAPAEGGSDPNSEGQSPRPEGENSGS